MKNEEYTIDVNNTHKRGTTSMWSSWNNDQQMTLTNTELWPQRSLYWSTPNKHIIYISIHVSDIYAVFVVVFIIIKQLCHWFISKSNKSHTPPNTSFVSFQSLLAIRAGWLLKHRTAPLYCFLSLKLWCTVIIEPSDLWGTEQHPCIASYHLNCGALPP